MNAQRLQPAFVDPVLDAQRGFRGALKALAEPGLIQSLPAAPSLEGLRPLPMRCAWRCWIWTHRSGWRRASTRR